jgi:hypothetical protein
MARIIRVWLKPLGLLVAAVTVAFTAGACTQNSTSPTPPPPAAPSCQTNNTASIRFENRSNTNTTYDVVWDGSKLTTVAPGSISSSYPIAAGVQHTLQFKITNTNTPACSTSTPTLAQCESSTYWCTH